MDAAGEWHQPTWGLVPVFRGALVFFFVLFQKGHGRRVRTPPVLWGHLSSCLPKSVLKILW